MTDDEILRKWDACGRPVKWRGPIVSPLWVVPFARAIEEQARREEREKWREAAGKVVCDLCGGSGTCVEQSTNAIVPCDCADLRALLATDSAASSASECGYCKRPRVVGGCGWHNCPYQLHDSATEKP